MWISQDPLQYVNGANEYQFVGGNPISIADPTGLFCWSCFWAVVDYGEMAADMVTAVATATAALDAWAAVPGSGPAAPEDAFLAESLTATAIVFSINEYNDISSMIANAQACEKCDPCHKSDMESKIKTAEHDTYKLNDLWDKMKKAAEAVGHLIHMP